MPNEHAFISPSGLAALEKCPGKAIAEQGYPRSSGEAAIDGTHSHTLREICLSENRKAEEFIGRELSDHEGSFVVDAERVRRVQRSIDNLAPYVGKGKLLVEEKVVPGYWFDAEALCWGTADTVIIGDDFLMVDDFKDGGQPVYAENNLQLAAYALGALFPILETLPGNSRIRMSINQPKVRQNLDVWEISKDELIAVWPGRIEKIVKDALDPDAPRKPGDHCKWCLHKQNCQERLAAVSEITNNLMSGIPTPTSEGQVIPLGVFSVPAIDDNVSDDDLAKYLDYKDIVIGWFKDIEVKAMERAKAGHAIPGRKLVRGETRRSWIKDQESIIKAMKGLKLKKADYLEEKLISFTKVLGNNALTERQRKRIEAELIVKPAGELTLVPESDRRPAVSLDVQKTFQAIPAGEVLPETQSLTFL